MAYPTVDAPYGLIPVNLIGGQVYAGAVRHIPIASAYDTAIFNGDLVKLVAAGTVEKDTGTTAATPVGVFVGCQYVNSDGEFVTRNNWIADTVATDAVALVADDPDLVMKVAMVSGTTVVAPYTRAEVVGANVSLVQNAGNALNGRSKVAVDGTSANTTNTLPMRVIDLVEETKDSNGEYVECLVKFNVGHQYTNTTGLA